MNPTPGAAARLLLATTRASRRPFGPARLLHMMLATAVLATAAGANAADLTPQELFEEGNRLYRDELYWAALLRYRQAGEAGLSTPLLHYNEGVAHYRARQYERARDSLLAALDSPELRVATQYNLALAEYAVGNEEEALRWFRLVRDQQENRKLAAYATEAIARIRAEQESGIEEVYVETRSRRVDEPVAHFELDALAGFGTDTNAYRTPSQSYVDYSNPAAPTVNPVALSGAYIPFELGLKYRVDAYTNESFFAAYRLAGVSYQDVGLNDADEYAHELSIGSEYRARDDERDRETEVYSAFSVARHQEWYYDPATGSYFITRDEDGNVVGLEERMDYLRYGPELNFRQTYSKLTFGAGFKGQLWNYTNVEAVPEYDHEYLVLTGFAQYKFFPSSLVRMTLQGALRNFGDRPSYNLAGEVQPENPDLEYTYVGVQLTARQRILDDMWIGLDYAYTERTDGFEGYNDYIRDTFGLNFRWRAMYRLDVGIAGTYMLYDFPRTYAFNNPTQPLKTLERVDVSAEASFRLSEHLYIVGDVTFVDSSSNDLRINYDRAQYSIGVRWAM